jgi:hypothetical protein
MKRLVLDAEANHFLDLATTIHVVCVADVDSGETWTFRDREPFLAFLQQIPEGSEVIGHNIWFDLSLFRKLWSVPFSIAAQTDTFAGVNVRIVDTWHLSMLLNPDRQGGHSLDNLAKLAGTFKQEYKGGFEVYTDEMLQYNIQDVKATVEVYKFLMKEAEKKHGGNSE